MHTHPRTFAAALALVMTLPGCQADPEPTTPVTIPAPIARPVTPVPAVQTAPELFYGKQVRITGEIIKVLGDRGFELDGAGWAFNDNITVLTPTPVQVSGGPLAERDELIVTGVVRPFVAAELERSLGWDITPELEVKLSERPVLVADTVRKIGETGHWSAEGTARPISAVAAIVTHSDLDALDHQHVDLDRERVVAVTGKGLWIGPSVMSQIFVLPAAPPADIKVGDTVRVSGTLRRSPGDAATLWALPLAVAPLARVETLFVDNATVQRVQRPPGV